jgi:TPR repeat protein
MLYGSGRGVEVDLIQSRELFLRATELGNADAQCNLAFAHHRGLGVERNMDAAKQWYQMAANQGHADARCNLGFMYQHKHSDVEPKIERAFS